MPRPSLLWYAQAEAMAEFEGEHQLFQGGAYTQTLQEWLLASWQGDALQVTNPSPACVPAH